MYDFLMSHSDILKVLRGGADPKISDGRVIHLDVNFSNDFARYAMTLKTTAKEMLDEPLAIRHRLHKMLDDLIDAYYRK